MKGCCGKNTKMKSTAQIDKLDTLRNRFVYRKDYHDKWTIMKQDDVHLFGDCEDFALTALWLESDKSMLKFWWNVLTFRAIIWFVKTQSGEGHAALWMKNRGWIDNIYMKAWREKCPHKKVVPFAGPLLALKMLIARK